MRRFELPGLLLIHGDFLTLPLEPESVDLIVTSPPYNVGMDYCGVRDDRSVEEYLEFSAAWLDKALRLLRPDGRLCLNIPIDTTRPERFPMAAQLTSLALRLGFRFHGDIVWLETSMPRRTAWGSWCSPRAVAVCQPVELIVVLYRSVWRKLRSGVTDLAPKEFLDWTTWVWTFQGASDPVHPAVFPPELPYRCIKLFSYVGETVLDPFAGSGTTPLTAWRLGRQAIGIELSERFFDLMVERARQLPLPETAI